MKAIRVFKDKEQAHDTLPLNKPKLLNIKGERFMIVRTSEGIFISSNSCPHLGEQLNRGSINFQNEIICPLHSYRFNLITGQEATNRCSDLKTYRVKETEDGIFVNL